MYLAQNFFCCQTFINSSALLKSLMALQPVHVEGNTFGLILSFYCINTSYPMDNCFTGRCDRSRQTSEKDVLYIIPTGPARRVHSPGGASYFLFLSRPGDVIASFSFGAWRVKTCFYFIKM